MGGILHNEYSLGNRAQPEVFTNAFSGIWWAASTLLTVGYGDIYPVTTIGKIFGIFIAFLGVGMVAIPTSIISAGFVDQYSRLKRIGEYGQEEDVHFIRICLTENDQWVNHRIMELNMPERIIIALWDKDPAKSQDPCPKGRYGRALYADVYGKCG